MFYSKTAALAQHVGEITKILQEIYRDTDKKILDIELRNRAQCLILLGYTLRRRKTNKPFVPAEKSEWIQLYNNGACAMKDYCDMGMQVYVAKKCEDVKCLIVPGCAGGGGGGGGGGKSGGGGSKGGGGGIDLLQDIKDDYKHAYNLNENYKNKQIQEIFENNLSPAYNYLINNCEKIMNDEACKLAIFDFNLYYNLILDIANILEYDNENELNKYVIDLVNKINDYCSTELTFYDYLLPNIKNNREIQNKEYNIIRLQNKLRRINSNFFTNLIFYQKEKLIIFKEFAIELVFIRKELKENKISPDE